MPIQKKQKIRTKADLLLKIIPPAMQMIRREMRRGVASNTEMKISVPQFRVLARLTRGTFLAGELAEFIGVSFPSMSRMIDHLVKKKLISKKRGTLDKREFRMNLTDLGKSIHLNAQQKAHTALTKNISTLSKKEKLELAAGLQVLEKLISHHAESINESSQNRNLGNDPLVSVFASTENSRNATGKS